MSRSVKKNPFSAFCNPTQSQKKWKQQSNKKIRRDCKELENELERGEDVKTSLNIGNSPKEGLNRYTSPQDGTMRYIGSCKEESWYRKALRK